MKKFLSALLSVLLVISSFISVFTVTTVAAEETASTGPQNLITNGDFETYAGINNEHNNSAIPALAYRNVATVFPTDKVNGQWYRSTGGISPIKKASDGNYSPDLDENKLVLTATDLETKYPTYFGANNQMVVEPGNTANHVLRIVQDCYTQIDEPENGGTYTLSFKFRIPTSETSLKYLDLQYISPKLNLTNGKSIQNELKNPYSITNPTNTVVTDENGNDVTSNCTFSSLEATNNNNTSDDNSDDYKYEYLRIAFSTALTDSENWYTAKVTFTTTKNDDIAQPMSYTHTDGKTYTSPIALKLSYSPYGIAAIGDVNTVNTVTDAIYDYYTKNALYLDDFTMYECINTFENAKFYDKDWNPLENSNEYVGINTTVNGEKVSGLYIGDVVTATLDYNTDCNVFAGWFKNGVLFSREESITFTVNDTDKYYPKFINKNILTGAASYENGTVGSYLDVQDKTKYPEVYEWGVSTAAGYYRVRKAEVIYDKDHKSYQQTSNDATADSTLKNKVTVTDAKAYRGNNSLLLNNGWATLSTGLNVKKKTNYTLTYYITATGFSDDEKYKDEIKHTGVATTLNVANDITPTALDGGNASAMNGGVGNFPNGIAMVRQSSVAITENVWQKITLKFNSGEFEKLYFVVSPNNQETYYIDELSLVEEEIPETVAIEFKDSNGDVLSSENAANIFANASVEEDIFDGTKTVTIDYDRDSGAYAFGGWYYDGAFVTADETLLLTGTSYTDIAKLKAVIISANLLTGAASFENYAAGTVSRNTNDSGTVDDEKNQPPTGDEWAMVNHFAVTSVHGEQAQHYYSGSGEKGEATSYTAGTVSPRSGNVMLRFPTHYQTAVRAITVDKNTDYKLTFYVNAPDAYSTFSNIYLSTIFDYKYSGNTMINNTVAAMKNLGEAFYGSTYGEWKEWKKVELEFNSGDNETLYLCLLKSAAIKNSSVYNDCFVDDMSLVKLPSADVQLLNTKGQDITAQRPNEIQPAITNSTTKPGYLVADASNYEDGAFEFKGWYSDGKLVETNKTFEFANGAYTKLTAKVVSRNLLSATASYEGYDVNTSLTYTATDSYPSGAYFGGNKNAGYLGQTKVETIYDNQGKEIQQQAGGDASPETNGVVAKVTSDKAHSGGKSVYLENQFRTASLGIDVTPNTDYILSYYILAPVFVNGTVNTIEKSAIATTLNTGGDKNTTSIAPANKSLNQADDLYLSTVALTTKHDGENWIKVTHSFNSINLDKVYLIFCQNSSSTGGTSKAYIDDITMIECVPTEVTVSMKSCASIDPVDCDFGHLFVGQNVKFKVVDNQSAAPTVKANGEVITPDAEGVYSFKALETTNTLSVDFGTADDSLNDYDKGYNGEILSKYDEDVYLTSIWEGNTVYQEPALFVGETETKQFLYPVSKIVSLRSYDLKTNYVEGVDYEVTSDGKIKRLAGSRIPLYTNPLTTTTKPADNVFPLKAEELSGEDQEYLCFIGDTVFPQYAVSVTYEHTTTFADGYTPAAPASQADKLQNTITKLKNGEKVNIVVFGDSISTGRSSSGQNSTTDIYTAENTEGKFANLVINVAPYAPTWIDMLVSKLSEQYPGQINLKNLSLGGMGSKWGSDNIAARLALWKDENDVAVTPDLLLIGFGVNDVAGGVSKDNYKTNIQNIIKTARDNSGNQDMEVLLYSPMLPNQRVETWDKTKLIAYENALDEIANADEKIGLLKLTSIFTEIIKSKDCVDYLNTNVNHGNDFTARIYAAGLLAALSGGSITEYNGTAIRVATNEKPQALRYKFSISKDVFNGSSDYGTLVEYGSLAIPSSYLEGAELIKDGKYKNSSGKTVSPAVGITYSSTSGKHTIFADDTENNRYIFTAALYNIGYNSTDKTTNYTAWGRDYSVRNYAIFEKDGKQSIVYDATIAVSSVFKVMYQIELAYENYQKTGYLPDGITAEKLTSDYKAVQNILGDANSEQTKAYQVWTNANATESDSVNVTADTTNGDAGYVTKVGRKYVAVPYTGNEFDGWYDGSGNKVSNDTSLTIADITNNGGTVVAKFIDNNMLSNIAGAEKLTSIKMYKAEGTTEYEVPTEDNYFYLGETRDEANGWQSVALNTNTDYVHSGSKSIKIDARTQSTSCIVMKVEKMPDIK